VPTNYFSPVTYLPRQPIKSAFTQTPIAPLDQGTIDTINNQGAGAFANGAGPNSAARALLATQLGTGPDSLTTQANTQMGLANQNVRKALRGYGGVSFGVDDTSTPDVNEGLMVNYQPDKLGSRDRQAVIAARSQANARGMAYSGFGDQLVGAALQRTTEEARAIVGQYAQQINQIATTTNQNVQSAITTLGGLYGSDTTWNLQQEAAKPPPTPPAPVDPAPAAPDPNAGWIPTPVQPTPYPGWTPSPAGPPGRKVYAKGTTPGPKTLDQIYGPGRWIKTVAGDGRIVISWQ
jgi:hypothetical protein